MLTSACIDRIFEECHTYGGELDYKSFLDFVICLENRSSKAAQRFLFRLLDVQHAGRVTLADVRRFFLFVAAKLRAAGHDGVDVANVCDEVWDMVRPRNAAFFTLADLLACKMGGTACGILLDTAAFVAYDGREELRNAFGAESAGVAADADWDES